MRWLLALLVGSTAFATSAWSATLEIVVGNLRATRGGTVLVTVCPQDGFLSDYCDYSGRTPVRGTEGVVRVENIPPGIYAVQAFQDEDGSGRIPRSFLGVPRVGIGFSNDAPFRFGPPRFTDAAIQLGAQGGRIRLNLRYFD